MSWFWTFFCVKNVKTNENERCSKTDRFFAKFFIERFVFFFEFSNKAARIVDVLKIIISKQKLILNKKMMLKNVDENTKMFDERELNWFFETERNKKQKSRNRSKLLKKYENVVCKKSILRQNSMTLYYAQKKIVFHFDNFDINVWVHQRTKKKKNETACINE